MKSKILLLCLLTANSFAGEVIATEALCEKTEIVFDTLKDKYGEIPVITGKSGDVAGSLMTIWTNPTNDSWTIVATKDDVSCIIGTGDKLKVIDYKRKRII